MKQRIANALALLCMALAIGAVIGSVRATLSAGAIEGPSALLVARSGEVWLGVNQELWRVSAEGRLIERQPIATTGLPGAPAHLVHAPDGSVVANVRRDPTLYWMDAASARVVRHVLPQWPDALAKHGGRAINFAFDAQARVAVATGGGDAVALFDDVGRFIAQTPPSTYVFTNGLWWSEAGWWTTDTNRFALRLLDVESMQPLRAVELDRADGGSYLGPARALPRGGGAALIRFHGNMIDGGVSLVGADGSVKALPHGAPMQPRGLDWRGDELLVSDGVSFSILRWSAQGAALAPFGDADLQAALQAQRQERDALKRRHALWLGAAGAAFVLGLMCAGAAAWLARRERPAAVIDLSRLGTAQLSRREVMRLNWRMNGWVLLAFAPLLALQLAGLLLPREALKGLLANSSAIHHLLVASGLLLMCAIPIWLGMRRIKQLSPLPEYEPLLNQLAMAQLKRSAATMAHLLRPGEHVLEVFHLRPGLVWWALTSERLLGFNAALGASALKSAHELTDVNVAANAPRADGWKQRLLHAGSDGAAWLRIEIEHAPPLAGSVASPVLAARVIERINERAAALRAMCPMRGAPVKTDTAARRRRAALASLLLPGLGPLAARPRLAGDRLHRYLRGHADLLHRADAVDTGRAVHRGQPVARRGAGGVASAARRAGCGRCLAHRAGGRALKVQPRSRSSSARPSGQSPSPDSPLMCPRAPISMRSAPQSRAICAEHSLAQ